MTRVVLLVLGVAGCGAEVLNTWGQPVSQDVQPKYDPLYGKRLGDAILEAFDHDKSDGVTMHEVNLTLLAISEVPGQQLGTGLYPAIEQAKHVVPALFRIVDEDDDKEVTGKELLWVSEMHDTLKAKPVLKGLTNALFGELDTDASDKLTAEEIRAAIGAEGVVPKLVAIFDERFPIPALKPNESSDVLLANLQPVFDAMDMNADGAIERKEALQAALSFKKQFVQAATMLQNSAAMLRMLVAARIEKDGERTVAPAATAAKAEL